VHGLSRLCCPLEYSAAALLHEGVVLLVGEAVEKDILLQVVVHEVHHVLDTFGHRFALDAVLQTQLVNKLLLV